MRKPPNSGLDCPHMRRKPARKAGFLVAGSMAANRPSEPPRLSVKALWIAIGAGIGTALGVTVFDNIGLGISARIPIGMASWLAMPRR